MRKSQGQRQRSNQSAKYTPSPYIKNRQEEREKKEEVDKRRQFGIIAKYRKDIKKRDKLLNVKSEGGSGSAPVNVAATHENKKEPRQYRQQNAKDGWKGTKKPSAMKKAQMEFRKQKNEKLEKVAAGKKRQEEREIAVENRRKKRLQKFKILSQKTPKGQPVMKGRIELLLAKIQANK